MAFFPVGPASRYRQILLPAGDGLGERSCSSCRVGRIHQWGASPGIRRIHPGADRVTDATEQTHQLVIFLQRRCVVLQGLTGQKSSRRSKPVLGEISITLLLTRLQAGPNPSALCGNSLSMHDPGAGRRLRASDNPPGPEPQQVAGSLIVQA